MHTSRSELDQALRLPGVWRASDVALAESPGVPTGWAALDARLPGAGWPRGALTELELAAPGIGEIALLAPALARLAREPRWLAWVDPPALPYAPALARFGIANERVLVLRPHGARDLRWSIEQLLRSGAASAVLAWLPEADERVLRRIQMAADAGGALAVCFTAPGARTRHSPAALRIALQGLGRRRVRLDVLKRRGSRLAAFDLDLAETTAGTVGVISRDEQSPYRRLLREMAEDRMSEGSAQRKRAGARDGAGEETADQAIVVPLPLAQR